MCMFLLAAVILAFCVRQAAEPDIWWHLRNAQNLIEHHSLLRSDTYSFTAAGSPWMNIEWLSEIPYYVAYKWRGLQGLLAVSFTVLLVIYAGVYYRCCRAGADCKDAVIATLVAISLGVVSIGPRTLLFGWLCMVALLLVLDHFRHAGRGLALLPPLFALWINLHPSWAFGMAVLGLTIAAGLIEGKWGLVVSRRWTSSELKKLLLALAASLAALMLNPFGYKLLLYPFEFVFHQQSNVQHIEEWQPVNFSTGNGKLMMIVIFALLAATLFSRRRWQLADVLLTAFALWMGLSHSRFLFFSGLIIVPVLAPYLALFTPYNPHTDKPWLNAAIMAGVVGLLITFYPAASTLQRRVEDQYPNAALKFMQQQQITGNIFNQYLWGGYIEWESPQLRPFIDGRADIFIYNGVFDDYFSAALIRQPFEVMDKYKINYALLEPERPLTYLLEQSPSWHQVYHDNVAVLLERTARRQNSKR